MCYEHSFELVLSPPKMVCILRLHYVLCTFLSIPCDVTFTWLNAYVLLQMSSFDVPFHMNRSYNNGYSWLNFLDEATKTTILGLHI